MVALGRIRVEVVPRRSKRRKTLAWVAGSVLALAIVAVVGISVYVGWRLSHLEPRPITANPAEYGLAYESVEFPSADGITLRGWFIPSENASQTIIFAHGYESNRLQPSVPALELARTLVNAGFNALLFDLRASGESDGDTTTLGYHEVKDVYGAVQWLKRQRPDQARQLGLIGFSMGAVTAILAAANEPAIEAVIADSPFSDLRSYLKTNMPIWTGLPNFPFTWMIMTLLPPVIDLDVDAVSPQAVMPRLTQPVLLIHTDQDNVIPASESQILAAAGNPARTQLWLVPSTRHVGAREVNPDVYDARVVEFFRTALSGPAL